MAFFDTADQPEPVSARVARVDLGAGETLTAVSRVFDPRLVRHCRLCPGDLCRVGPDGHCLVVYRRALTDDEAPLARMVVHDRCATRSEHVPNALRNTFGPRER